MEKEYRSLSAADCALDRLDPTIAAKSAPLSQIKALTEETFAALESVEKNLEMLIGALIPVLREVPDSPDSKKRDERQQPDSPLGRKFDAIAVRLSHIAGAIRATIDTLAL